MNLFKHLYFPNISIEWCCVALFIICFIIMVIKLFIQKEVFTKRKGYAIAILGSYVVVIFFLTVFARTVRDTRQYELRIFWTYRNIVEKGASYLVWQILYNLVMLLPVGFLIPYIGAKEETVLRELLVTISIGGMLSGGIETCQLVFRRGLFEIDDIIHNLVGVILGYAIFKVFEQMKEKKQNVQIHTK